MGYRGMGHMGNGLQGYGAHTQWVTVVQGAGVWGTCMGNEVQGYGAHGQWGTGVWGTQAMGYRGNGAHRQWGT